MLLYYLGELKIQQNSADIQQIWKNTNKLYLCTDFKSLCACNCVCWVHLCVEDMIYWAYKGIAIFFSLSELPLPGHLTAVLRAATFSIAYEHHALFIFSQEIHLSVSLTAVYHCKILTFLSKYCPHRWISCWLLTNTAVTSVVTNFWCHIWSVKANK